jgi:hypothetical protein
MDRPGFKRVIGQENVTEKDLSLKLLDDGSYGEAAGYKAAGEPFRYGDGPALGIPDTVGHIMQCGDQDIGRGSFHGIAHLPADPLEIVPGGSDGDGVNLLCHLYALLVMM